MSAAVDARARAAAGPEPAGPRIELTLDDGFEEGHRAILWSWPPAGTATRAVLLCMQPFAEEANFSRRMVVAQARRLAERGFAVMVPDPFGTGDSAGEFEAATLERWRDDLRRAAALAVGRVGAPLVLWGVRFGALLAADLLAAAAHGRPDAPVAAVALLAWHPIREGGEPVAQYRRLARLRRLAQPPTGQAAARGTGQTAGRAPRQPAADATRPTADRAPIESGGYRIAPALVDAMAGLRWPDALPCPVMQIEQATTPFWHALDAPLDEALFAATEQALQGWLDRTGAATAGSEAAPRAGSPRDGSPRDGSPRAGLPLAVDGAAVPHPASPDACERPLAFGAPARRLRGILHGAPGTVGVVVVPGQPQTRVGSHRMFVRLARALADAGHPTLRYDLAGHGDSDGTAAAYDATPGDVIAAVAALREAMPQLERVVLWGLCDGATAAALAMAGTRDPAGLVLVNPWVQDETLRAQAIVSSHYRARLASGAFWRRLVTGGVRVVPALREAIGLARRAWTPRAPQGGSPADRLLHALRSGGARACIVLSGDDLTAAQTASLLSADARWRRLATGLRIERLPLADHTLSREEDLQAAIAATLEFVRSG